MKLQGHAQEVTNLIVARFEEGNVGQALADVFINHSPHKPSSQWSWRNRFIMALLGQTADARGMKQWRNAGRKVRKGAKAFHILAPVIIKTEEERDGAQVTIQKLIGFKTVPVFAIEATEVFDEELWEKSRQLTEDVKHFLDELPLRQVAEAWGLEIGVYKGGNGKAKGSYTPGKAVNLGTKNLATWAHELIHAADDKLGNLGRYDTAKLRAEAEVVAELGGATLLIMMGHEQEADLGGAWEYVKGWSENDRDKAIRNCMLLIDRVCSAVDLIVNEYNTLAEKEAA